MAGDQPVPYTRLKALPAFFSFVLTGILLLWLSLSTLVPSMRAILDHASLVTLWPHSAIGIPLALAFFFLAATTMIPPSALGLNNARGKRRKPSRRWMNMLNVCFGMLMACVLLAVITLPITEITVLMVMPRLHYLSCPAPPRYERHPPQRWALSYDHCPL